MASFSVSVQVPWQVDDFGGAIRLWLIAFPIAHELELSTHELVQLLLGNTLDSYGFFNPTDTKSPHKSFLENIERVRDCVRDPKVVQLGFEVVAAEGFLVWHPTETEGEIAFQWKLEEP